MNLLDLQKNFSLFKGLGFVIATLVILLLQLVTPYRQHFKKDFDNSRRNFSIAGINFVLFFLICGSCVCWFAQVLAFEQFGLLNWIRMPLWLSLILSVVLLDFVAYIWHRANHRIPRFWQLHSLHHSDLNFDLSTSVRFHFGELAVSLIVRILVVGLFGISVPGLLLFELIYQFFNLFEHGNITLPEKFEKKLSHIFVTPALHRKHHSTKVQELNSNFATIFSVWDRIGGTYLASQSAEVIQVGLSEGQADLNLVQMLKWPIFKSRK